MAPTFIPWNKILEYQEKNLELEKNVAIDKNGNSTIIPQEANALIGIGGYKGFALASMVEVLCANLSGMPFGPHIPSMYGSSIKRKRKLGQFYIIFRNDVNISSEQFMESLKVMTTEVRGQEPINNQTSVQMPNDPQIKYQKDREENGIPVNSDILKLINLS